jgi:hypothetical protein
MDRGSVRPNERSKCLFQDQLEITLSSAENSRVKHTKDNLSYKIWIVRVYSDVFWINECTCLLEPRNAHTLTNMNAGERETAHKTFLGDKRRGDLLDCILALFYIALGTAYNGAVHGIL